MTIPACSGRTIRVRWPEALALLAALAGPPGATAQESGLDLAAAAAGRGPAEEAQWESLARRYPQLADYVAYWRARRLAAAQRHAEAAAALDPVWRTRFPSPLAGRAAVLGAESLVQAGRYGEALGLLEKAGRERPEPQGSLAEARARLGLGEKARAAELFQQVYCLYPLSKEAAAAEESLAGLAREPGFALPPARDELRMERAARLLAGGRHADARAAWLDLARTASSAAARQLALVRAAVALFEQRRTRDALAELAALRPSDAESDAERRHYLILCLRRLDEPMEMLRELSELRRLAPASRWTLRALIQAANHFLVRNESASYLPLFRACADGFPQEPEAAGCHWKVAWRGFLDHRSEAEGMLKEHLERFPASDRAGAALYYLGRLSEEQGNSAAAQAYFSELLARFPNFYYAGLAFSRPQPASGAAGANLPVLRFLESIRWPDRPRRANFTPDEEARWRIARARLLAAAELSVWAESELRFGVRNGAARWALALEAAEIASRRGAWGAAIRHIRGAVPEYLWLPRDAAPRRFWELAFPFPYRPAIEREARKHGLDPLLVAALIRQESEFDPGAVSPSGAIGLMQVMPATGRELGRRLRMRPVTRRSLHNPNLNLALGTYYLARLLEARGGRVEEALAAYNAGPTRVPMWSQWGDYREHAEFVETVPLAQTRDYVQIILRNLEFYRWLHGAERRAPPAADSPAAPAKKAVAAPAKKSAPAKPASPKKSGSTARKTGATAMKGARSGARSK